MTDRAPIPPEVFEDAIDRLDRDGLAAFVGRLEAAAGAADIDVDPPVVTVDDGNDPERILVAPDESGTDAARLRDADPTPDAIVVGGGGPSVIDSDVPVRTTEDLRQQLLYAVPPEVAESIAEEALGTPARSSSYVAEPTPAATTGEASDVDTHAADPGPGSAEPVEPTVSPVDEQTSGTPRGSQAPQTPDTEAESGTVATRNGDGFVIVGVLVVLILSVTGGVVYAAEISPEGDAGAFAAPAPTDDGGLSDAEIRRGSRDLIDASGAVATGTATPMPGEEDGFDGHPVTDDTEADRNIRPVPTCERSFLNVVQVQMNALKYNNNTTDDGIRTVRRFASPRNRQTIQTFDEFARVIKNPTYSPMLSYDSAQYTPIQSSDDFAQVQVLTREDGNVTGQYYFRLRKIEGGEYDGCWMTDAVVSIPETSDFSGKVAGQSTGSVNGTS